MTTTHQATAVTAEQIAEIAGDVWTSFLSMDLAPDGSEPLTGPTLTGCVHISGDWDGSVFVQCAADHARLAAEAMFAADPGTLSPDEVSDALGELTNMVGGNIKSLLPAPSKLSVPSVAGGDSYTLRIPGATRVEAVTLRSPGGPVHISIWKV